MDPGPKPPIPGKDNSLAYKMFSKDLSLLCVTQETTKQIVRFFFLPPSGALVTSLWNVLFCFPEKKSLVL